MKRRLGERNRPAAIVSVRWFEAAIGTGTHQQIVLGLQAVNANGFCDPRAGNPSALCTESRKDKHTCLL